MVFDFGISVKEYAERGKENQFPRIEECPHCHRRNEVIRYGYYSRWCWQLTMVIKRYFCKHCSKTFSLLPLFLCVGIGETLEVVERIIWHISQGKSYRAAREAIGRPDLSYQRLQYWCRRWKKRVNQLKAALPIKEMHKSLDIFSHLSRFFGPAQDSGRLFEAVNHFVSKQFYQAWL